MLAVEIFLGTIGGTNVIYCVHHFYHWIRGGLEYAQVHRAKILRKLGLDAKFIFTTMFPMEDIQHVTEEMGFLNSEVMWLNGFFTDCRISPVTYTLKQLEGTFPDKNFIFFREGRIATYRFPAKKTEYTAYMTDDKGDCVYRVEIASNAVLIRKDYYSYCKIYSEYYTPVDQEICLYQRRFFNEDGTVAYEEILDGDTALYKFSDRLLYSKDELLAEMISGLKLTEKDVVLIDAAVGTIDMAAIIKNTASARVGLVMHSNHFVEYDSDEEHVCWHPYYEYALSHPERISFYIASTDIQNALLKKQYMQYKGRTPTVVTIPPASLNELQFPQKARRKYSIVTASRLAFEKHVDWVIWAVAEAKKYVPDLTLDIYGEGSEKKNLQEQIARLHCSDYVRLCGHQKLDEIYQNYEVYVSASINEPFGITFMEAIGAGLAVIGFDVLYGSRNFIDEGENGYIIPWEHTMSEKDHMYELSAGIVRLFTEGDLEAFHKHSYEKARIYLTGEVEKKWKKVLDGKR